MKFSSYTNSGSESKLDIDDLSWEDKEKIFRLLYAKINGLASNIGISNQSDQNTWE